ncbi:hypothetical protein D046_5723A, partial [Vibrio parahaemolyticus V-223/04]
MSPYHPYRVLYRCRQQFYA